MFDDNELQQAVLAELRWEPSVVAAHIGVAATAGVVTLTGRVASYAQKHAAATAVLRVKDVTAVADEIVVLLPAETVRGDDELASAAVDRLAWDVVVPADAVKVAVADGWITLTGEVDWRFQKDAAEDDLRRLFGVTGVSNAVTIRSRIDLSNISDDIMHALHRSWFFDAKTIAVSAEGGRIRLSGAVRSPHDRQLAAATAWAAPGVTSVVNDIVVAEGDGG
jgi:osmotically-inducible protein OsmY